MDQRIELQVPTGIFLEYINSKLKKFFSNYDINLAHYIEVERVFDESVDQLNCEKKFIEAVGQYITNQNNVNKIIESEKTNEKLEKFSKLSNLPIQQIIKSYLHKNPNEDQKKIASDYLNFTTDYDLEDKNWNLRNTQILDFNSKIDFLILKSRKLSFVPSFLEGVKFNPPIEEEYQDPLNLSDEKTMRTARAKFIMLKELGVIDFLKDRLVNMPNESAIWKILSDITGMNQQHIWAGYKAWMSGSDTNNNPYREPKEGRNNPVDIVRNRLINYGVKLEK